MIGYWYGKIWMNTHFKSRFSFLQLFSCRSPWSPVRNIKSLLKWCHSGNSNKTSWPPEDQCQIKIISFLFFFFFLFFYIDYLVWSWIRNKMSWKQCWTQHLVSPSLEITFSRPWCMHLFLCSGTWSSSGIVQVWWRGLQEQIPVTLATSCLENLQLLP